ncbi:hypothetical protein ACFWXK_22890, partial [Streptomyces sp. NPDC059070]
RDLAWVVSPCLDLLPNGTTTRGPSDPTPGRLAPHILFDGLQSGRLPIMGTTVTLYTDLVRALGGWPALPFTQDAALVLNAEAVSPGWMQEQPGELYRQHPRQATRHRSEEERRICITSLTQHVEALRNLNWRYTPAPAVLDVPSLPCDHLGASVHRQVTPALQTAGLRSPRTNRRCETTRRFRHRRECEHR